MLAMEQLCSWSRAAVECHAGTLWYASKMSMHIASASVKKERTSQESRPITLMASGSTTSKTSQAIYGRSLNRLQMLRPKAGAAFLASCSPRCFPRPRCAKIEVTRFHEHNLGKTHYADQAGRLRQAAGR